MLHGVTEERLDRVKEAEALLEDIGTELLRDLAVDAELWPITAFSLAAHARSHHRALLDGLDASSPGASQIHARPIVETAILIDYLAEEPDVRVWAWVADGLKEQLKMLREWREAVESGDADDASIEKLTELIDRKEAEVAQVEEEARKAAAARDHELEAVELPSLYQQAKRDSHLFGLYTKAFRHLSGSVHVAATLFTKDRYGEAMSLLDDSLDDEQQLAIRALAAAVLAVVYADAARALGRDDVAERTGAVHEAMTGI
jgi:Family of unknown function (DUF5677)